MDPVQYVTTHDSLLSKSDVPSGQRSMVDVNTGERIVVVDAVDEIVSSHVILSNFASDVIEKKNERAENISLDEASDNDLLLVSVLETAGVSLSSGAPTPLLDDTSGSFEEVVSPYISEIVHARETRTPTPVRDEREPFLIDDYEATDAIVDSWEEGNESTPTEDFDWSQMLITDEYVSESKVPELVAKTSGQATSGRRRGGKQNDNLVTKGTTRASIHHTSRPVTKGGAGKSDRVSIQQIASVQVKHKATGVPEEKTTGKILRIQPAENATMNALHGHGKLKQSIEKHLVEQPTVKLSSSSSTSEVLKTVSVKKEIQHIVDGKHEHLTEKGMSDKEVKVAPKNGSSLRGTKIHQQASKLDTKQSSSRDNGEGRQSHKVKDSARQDFKNAYRNDDKRGALHFSVEEESNKRRMKEGLRQHTVKDASRRSSTKKGSHNLKDKDSKSPLHVSRTSRSHSRTARVPSQKTQDQTESCRGVPETTALQKQREGAARTATINPTIEPTIPSALEQGPSHTEVSVRDKETSQDFDILDISVLDDGEFAEFETGGLEASVDSIREVVMEGIQGQAASIAEANPCKTDSVVVKDAKVKPASVASELASRGNAGASHVNTRQPHRSQEVAAAVHATSRRSNNHGACHSGGKIAGHAGISDLRDRQRREGAHSHTKTADNADVDRGSSGSSPAETVGRSDKHKDTRKRDNTTAEGRSNDRADSETSAKKPKIQSNLTKDTAQIKELPVKSTHSKRPEKKLKHRSASRLMELEDRTASDRAKMNTVVTKDSTHARTTTSNVTSGHEKSMDVPTVSTAEVGALCSVNDTLKVADRLLPKHSAVQPEIAAYVDRLLCLEYDVKKYTSFYCNPCGGFYTTTALWEEHAASVPHKKNIVRWRECQELQTEYESCPVKPAKFQSDIDSYNGVLTGAEFVVEVWSSESGSVGQFVCLLCSAVCCTIQLLISHLTSYCHLDNHMERVNPDLYTPPGHDDRVSVNNVRDVTEEMKQQVMLAAKEHMTRMGKGVMRARTRERGVCGLDDRHGAEELEESLFTQFMERVFDTSSGYTVECKKVSAGRSVANHDRDRAEQGGYAAQLEIGTQYIVEIWQPSRRATPMYYCILCNQYAPNCSLHCGALKHCMVYFQKHYKSMYDCMLLEASQEDELRRALADAKGRVLHLEGNQAHVEHIIQLQMDPADAFLAMNATIAKGVVAKLNIAVSPPPRVKKVSVVNEPRVSNSEALVRHKDEASSHDVPLQKRTHHSEQGRKKAEKERVSSSSSRTSSIRQSVSSKRTKAILSKDGYASKRESHNTRPTSHSSEKPSRTTEHQNKIHHTSKSPTQSRMTPTESIQAKSKHAAAAMAVTKGIVLHKSRSDSGRKLLHRNADQPGFSATRLDISRRSGEGKPYVTSGKSVRSGPEHLGKSAKNRHSQPAFMASRVHNSEEESRSRAPARQTDMPVSDASLSSLQKFAIAPTLEAHDQALTPHLSHSDLKRLEDALRMVGYSTERALTPADVEMLRFRLGSEAIENLLSTMTSNVPVSSASPTVMTSGYRSLLGTRKRRSTSADKSTARSARRDHSRRNPSPAQPVTGNIHQRVRAEQHSASTDNRASAFTGGSRGFWTPAMTLNHERWP